MTARELIRELQRFPQDAMVFFVADWERTDENGCLIDLKEVTGVGDQVVIIDQGLDFIDEHQILIETE